jgi:hypothetical protein
MAMTPVMKDLAAFLNMCLVGCQEGEDTPQEIMITVILSIKVDPWTLCHVMP